MDIGVVVNFDGKRNIVYFNGESHEYPIGGMISEYARLHPAIIKPILLECPYNNDKVNSETVTSLLKWLFEKFTEKFPPVTANIVFTDFFNCIHENMNSNENERNEMFKELNKDIETDSVMKFILEDTQYTEFGMDDIGQMLLSAYAVYASSYVAFKYSFMMLASGDEYDEDKVMKFWSLYTDEIELQHIDFKIIFIEKSFCSVYTIKSSMSLILFEAAHVLDNETVFIKCQNCGEYFVPTGRSDARYCSYPSPQDISKSCKDIGAQVARAEKEKNDVATKSYRKVYMRYMTHLSRHPNDEEGRSKLKELTSGIKEWRKKMQDGTETVESFLDWLNDF